jgi:hypothetical protein
MKTLFKYLLLSLLLVFSFSSCKKKPKLHKLKYEIVFYVTPPVWYPSVTSITANPNYHDDKPVKPNNLKPGDVWNYEYWELKDGDVVNLSIDGAYFENSTGNNLKWVYTLRVYVDGEVYAQKPFYHTHPDIETFGTDNTDNKAEYIRFTYKER